jgi:ribosome-associated heat shock protein Hsp15
MTESAGDTLRIDKWLWAARFFKTRALAAAAVAGGKVKIDGERVKAAKPVRAGDRLSIHVGPYEHLVQVRGVSARRGPAPEAARLYEESDASKAARQALAVQLAAERAAFPRDHGRPTKRARRELIRFKQGHDR